MKFTPTKYAVMYHGERHPVGVTFDIDPADAEKMSAHGTVKADKAKTTESTEATEQTAKKTGKAKSK